MSRSDQDTLALQASEAQVTTCTVTIKTLRVGNRQLTQSVFKQLPRCNLIVPGSFERSGSFELTGNVWGWVNHEVRVRGARWFVVQKGSELHRAWFLPMEVDRLMRMPEAMSLENYMWSLLRDASNLPQAPDLLTPAWDALVADLLAFDQLYIAA